MIEIKPFRRPISTDSPAFVVVDVFALDRTGAICSTRAKHIFRIELHQSSLPAGSVEKTYTLKKTYISRRSRPDRDTNTSTGIDRALRHLPDAVHAGESGRPGRTARPIATLAANLLDPVDGVA
ncbi:MAG: hypothetical protein GX458_20625 [Phyllobacteriaceae bacterium]|nr:hypothetical protein [Phyllobacteriaceae bacterium]